MSNTAVARQALNALAARQEAVLTRIEGKTDARQRVWSSAPHIWSLAQILQHLGLGARALLKSERPGAKLGGRVKFLVMRVVLKSPARLKLPPGVPLTPAPDVSWDDAVASARGTLQTWSAYLDTARQDAVFMHPFAGGLTTDQAITFLQDHFEHHVAQINRLLTTLPRQTT
ncbi:MAG TPA: DinB family protein [Gemmatimonadaceae bacterium]|jgi:hypothetical protein|nr:DinB family protein [Gemmatimonadaceae bacterium]